MEGINKLYIIHNKIRELYTKNIFELRTIEKQKLYISMKIKHILLERELLHRSTKVIFFSIEDIVADFYENFQEMIKYVKGSNGQSMNSN